MMPDEAFRAALAASLAAMPGGNGAGPADEGAEGAPAAEPPPDDGAAESLGSTERPNPRELAREFTQRGENGYRLAFPGMGIAFEVDRLRRDRHELIGELSVTCLLPGARTVNDTLSVADCNLSSARARTERAKLLAERAQTENLDWAGLVEEFAQRVLRAEREGRPAVDLRELPRPAADDAIEIEGLTLPRRHPAILFGDGGAAKSYTALWLAGRLAQSGIAVALFDWELAGEDHRERLERLFGGAMPQIFYARCEKPLVYEADRLTRIVRENEIQYAVYDSIAFACDGPPEAAEVASRYFRAVRQINVGSLHVAHVNKSDNGDQKPFGSAFWHNGARSTWFVKRAEEGSDSDVISLGVFNRKANLGKIQKPVGFSVTFADETTTFRRSDVADTPELAARLTVTQRMAYLLRRGSKTVTEIAEELEVEVNTVTQTVNRSIRKGGLFIILEGQNTNRRVGLKAS